MAMKTSDWRPGPTVCRCCLNEGCYKDISTEYFWMGKREVYAEMLSDTLSLTIGYAKSGPNSNSRLICEACISRLRDAHDFRRQVQECEKTFMNYIDPGSNIDVDLEEIKVENVKQEKKNSDDEDFDDRVDFEVNNDSDDDLDDEPLMKLATKVPKKEKEVDLLDLLDNTQITVKRKSTPSTSKSKEPATKKSKKIVIKTAGKAKASSSKTEEKKKKGPIRKKCSTPSTHARDERDNAINIFKFSNASPFKYYKNTFGCAHCTFKSADFGPIKVHTREHRDTLVYKKKNLLTWKADVSDLCCELCKAHMADVPTLFDHLIEAHNKPLNRNYKPGIVPYLLDKGFACADCGQSFDYFHNLNVHVNKHYHNFICSECGKTCTSQMRLNNHIQSTHDKSGNNFKCSKCDETFPTLYKSQQHMTSAHDIRRHKCPYCTDTFKYFKHRIAHLNNVHGKNITYPCKFCSKIFNSASNRATHTKGVHIKENPVRCEVCDQVFHRLYVLKRHMLTHSGTKEHQCLICNKAFGRKYALTQHMRIHNNDKRFVCVHCGKAFVQKCNLKNHSKSHHYDSNFGEQTAYLTDSSDNALLNRNHKTNLLKNGDDVNKSE